MATLVPAVSRHEIARSIYRDIVTGNDYYYVFAGKSLPWGDPDTPDVPVDTRRYLSEVHKNMLFVKRVVPGPNDVVYMIRRINWTAGTSYVAYSDDVDLSEQDFYVMTDDYNIYKCLDNNSDGLSTTKPTSTDGAVSATQRLSDGYIWKFMYQVPTLDRIKFLTNAYIPVRNVSDGVNFDVNGNITGIEIERTGENYTDPVVIIEGDGTIPENGVISVSKNIDNGISEIILSGDYSGFTFARVRIVDSTGSGFKGKVLLEPETANKINQDVVESSIAGAIYRVDVVNSGSGYTQGVPIAAVGNGIDAQFQAVVSSGHITGVQIVSQGRGYDYVRFELSPVIGTPAILKAQVGPHGGHGSNIAEELYAKTICIASVLDSENTDLFVGNDFRQLGIVKNIIVPNTYPAELLSSDTGTGSYIITVPALEISTYNTDDEILSDKGGLYKVVTTTTDNTVYLLYMEGDSTLTKESTFINVTTNTPNLTCTEVSLPDFDKNSGIVLYVNNLSPIERTSQEVETVKLFLHF